MGLRQLYLFRVSALDHEERGAHRNMPLRHTNGMLRCKSVRHERDLQQRRLGVGVNDEGNGLTWGPREVHASKLAPFYVDPFVIAKV